MDRTTALLVAGMALGAVVFAVFFFLIKKLEKFLIEKAARKHAKDVL
jgi:hypothetical protein